MKLWVTPLSKQPRPAAVLVESERNPTWLMEENDDEYQLASGSAAALAVGTGSWFANPI